MLYFGGGYPGLQVAPPPVAVPAQPSVPFATDLVVEIPMLIVTGGTTRRMTITTFAHQPLWMLPRVRVTMSQGVAVRVAIPARVLTRASVGR